MNMLFVMFSIYTLHIGVLSYFRCEDLDEDVYCEDDADMQNLTIRFYDITVTASDSAGNTGSDTCKVIIVPSCNPSIDGGCDGGGAGGGSKAHKTVGKSSRNRILDDNVGPSQSQKYKAAGNNKASKTHNVFGKSGKSSKGHQFYYTLDVVNDAVTSSRLLNQVTKLDLVWEYGLGFPY